MLYCIMLLRHCIFLFFILIIGQIKAQTTSTGHVNKVRWLKENAIHVRSINPADEDFSDFQMLKKWIGNAQVVSIGEPIHQLGSVNHAKARLIKFLHQQMGFDMIAIESGMYDLAKAWKQIQGGQDAYNAYRRNMFWAEFDEYVPLFNYIQTNVNSSHPLELAGFDSHLMGSFSHDSLVSDLSRFFSKIGYHSPQLSDTSDFAKQLLLSHSRNGYKVNKGDLVLKELSVLKSKLDSLAPKPLSKEASFYKQILQSTQKHIENCVLDKARESLSGSAYDCASTLSLTIRDEQMADNLLWHLKQNPNRKIIVLAHNTHLIKDYPGDRKKQRWNDNEDAPPAPKGACEENYMGYVIADALKEKLFNIAFTVGEGTAGVITWGDSTKSQTWAIQKSNKQEVLENFLDAAGLPNAIVNLKQPEKGGEWLMDYIRIRYYTGPGSRYQWNKAADAIFYVKEATPLHLKK
jgi:erythromycin esterase